MEISKQTGRAVDWQAKWIWNSGDPNPWDYYLCARKTFQAAAAPSEAWLHITADTRYVVWINGERIGQGPVRAWPRTWRYDSYDLRGRLKDGENQIAVLVQHYGIGTFQSFPTRGGLLAQVETDGRIAAATDSTWKLSEHPAYTRDGYGMPRITCQQPWAEFYDALREHQAFGGDWTRAEVRDDQWESAAVVGPAGCDPWTSLTPREIPFLTEEPLYPVNVLQADITRRPPTVWGFELRRNLLPGIEDANPHRLVGFVATVLETDEETEVTLYSANPGNNAPGHLRVNGREAEHSRGTGLPFDGGSTYRFTLQPGQNLLVWDVTGNYHSWSCAWVVNSSRPIDKHLELADGQNWITFGPFESNTDADFKAVQEARNWADLQAVVGHMKPLTKADTQPFQPFLETAHASCQNSLPTRPFAALASAGEDITAITPSPEGDVRIMLDFGKITVGFWEMDIVDAPAGVEIDVAAFESIQDGHWDLTWGLVNAVRYRTRKGSQKYHSVLRRGGRYMLLTLHFPQGETAPVRIRSIRTLQNTYPCVERGAFQSSDYLLNRVWEIGQYTTRLCSEDTYVDCPTYEQTFWVGDSRNEGAVNHYAFGEYDLSRRCLLLAAESMERSPIVESQVPSAWEDILPTWSLLWALACEEYWQITGDRDFLEEIYPWIVKQNQHCLDCINDQGLLVLPGWNLLDWAPLETPGESPNTHIQGWFAMVLERTARMARALGKDNEAEEALATRQNILDAANRLMWNEERQAYVDSISREGVHGKVISQQTNTIALLSGIATGERAEIIRPLIVEAPEGVVPVGSPFFMFFTFEALAAIGEFETILDITRRKWGFMLDKGATTCWEVFPGFEGNGRYTRSHCHAWSAAPTYFQSRYQLGVAPLEPGFAKVEIAPVPAGLTWAAGRVPTPHGVVEVAWEQDGGIFRISAVLPPQVEGIIRVPLDLSRPEKLHFDGATMDTRDGKPVFVVPAGGSASITVSPKEG